jgi:DNA-binding SARP family transcriptional activator
VRAAKERALLLLLLLHANEVVSAERLIDELWGERPPESAANVLQTYVSHLRRLLEPGTRPRENGLIVTRSPGYLLRLAPGQLDRHRFETLVAEARSSAEPAAALANLREALALWRGPPLPEFTFEAFAQAEIARLEELRLTALEERIELELELDPVVSGDLVGELQALVDEHPLHERLQGQLMLALYRSGRQAEALDAYQRTRRTLVDELGIEPGQACSSLKRRS